MAHQNDPSLFPKLNLRILQAKANAVAEEFNFIREINVYLLSHKHKKYGFVVIMHNLDPKIPPWDSWIDEDHDAEIEKTENLEFPVPPSDTEALIKCSLHIGHHVPDVEIYNIPDLHLGPKPNGFDELSKKLEDEWDILLIHADEDLPPYVLKDTFWRLYPKTPISDQPEEIDSIFPTPPNTTWEDITIKFLDEEKVSINVKGTKKGSYLFNELGFAKPGGKEPNQQWWLLRTIANNDGIFPDSIKPKSTSMKPLKISQGTELEEIPDLSQMKNWDIPGECNIFDTTQDISDSKRAINRLKQLFSRTRRTLKKLFGLSGDPLPYIHGASWQARISILPPDDLY